MRQAILLLIMLLFGFSASAADPATTLPEKKATARLSKRPSKANSSPKAAVASPAPKAPEPPKTLVKSPKAIFLIKRAKIDSDIGEPVMYPFERQLKNVYYDIPGGQLRND